MNIRQYDFGKYLNYAFAALVLMGMIVAAGIAPRPATADAPRISKEDLRAMIGSPDLVIIDVRTEKEWKKSDKRIAGSTWEDADEFDVWSKRYPKDKTIVLYCS